MEHLTTQLREDLANEHAKDTLAGQYQNDEELTNEVIADFQEGFDFAKAIWTNPDKVAGYNAAIERLRNPNFDQEAKEGNAEHYRNYEREHAEKVLMR